MNTEIIKQHSSIGGHYFDQSYDEALKAARQELLEDIIPAGLEKKDWWGSLPVKYLAFGKGRPERIYRYKKATTFDRLLEVLDKWTAYRSWVITWPIDPKCQREAENF
ncbi:hypothetical protein COOONC_24370 [Cooperia oncophora]